MQRPGRLGRTRDEDHFDDNEYGCTGVFESIERGVDFMGIEWE